MIRKRTSVSECIRDRRNEGERQRGQSRMRSGRRACAPARLWRSGAAERGGLAVVILKSSGPDGAGGSPFVAPAAVGRVGAGILGAMRRLVLDTNIFVAAAYNPDSASRKIVEDCRRGRLRILVSPALLREYERMLPRAIRDARQLELARDVIRRAERVEPAVTPIAIPSDPDDDKLFAAAWAGRADALITNDEAVLRIDGAEGIRVVRPGEFLRMRESGDRWRE